jgi:hypothetical protein
MANLVDRGGSVKVRVGGNTQDTAVLVDETPNGADLREDEGNISGPVSRHIAAQTYCSLTHSATRLILQL